MDAHPSFGMTPTFQKKKKKKKEKNKNFPPPKKVVVKPKDGWAWPRLSFFRYDTDSFA